MTVVWCDTMMMMWATHCFLDPDPPITGSCSSGSTGILTSSEGMGSSASPGDKMESLGDKGDKGDTGDKGDRGKTSSSSSVLHDFSPVGGRMSQLTGKVTGATELQDPPPSPPQGRLHLDLGPIGSQRDFESADSLPDYQTLASLRAIPRTSSHHPRHRNMSCCQRVHAHLTLMQMMNKEQKLQNRFFTILHHQGCYFQKVGH